MTIDKAQLRALAEACGEQKKTSWLRPGMLQALLKTGAGDAEYIAAASPATVLALLADIEQLEAKVRLAGVAGDMAVHQAVGRAATDFGVAVLERDQLKAENEELRKDAERYRWLRVESRPAAELDAVFNKYGVPVDEAIDAAMAEEASHG